MRENVFPHRPVTQLANIRISELCARYGLNSRQTIYDRIKNLGINIIERGKIRATDLQLMDELDKHIKLGGKIENFAQAPQFVNPEIAASELSSLRNDNSEAAEEDTTFNASQRLVERLLKVTNPTISLWEELINVIENGYIHQIL